MSKNIKLTDKEKKLLIEVKKGEIPKHVALIMDGNGRWAKKRGLPRVKGHEKGIKSLFAVFEMAKEIGVKYITFYTFSKENWARPKSEVNYLIKLLKKYLKDNTEKFVKENIVFNTIGDIQDFDDELMDLIQTAKERTKNQKGIVLTLALSYGARDEIVRATRNILKEGLNPEKLDKKLFSSYLFDVPDVDLMIRTSGEIRISNYLLWQLSYAELYFTKILWPDFRKYEFLKAIQNYQKRERRFGKI
jgi:undecaprenyl diphosphate synthase